MKLACSITGCGKRCATTRYLNEVVLAHDGDECLTWPFAKDVKGYGQLRRNGVMKRVHRLICRAVNGPPPTPEHHAAHLCGNASCCAPRHLAWKTRAENEADKLSHGTSNRGERNGKAKLTSDQVLEIRSLRGIETKRSIADRFGVSRGAVDDIQAGRKWSWL